MLPSADKLYGDADLIFKQDLAPTHTAKGTKNWFNDNDVTVLDWPANSPDLNPIENLWSIVKRKMRDTRPNKQGLKYFTLYAINLYHVLVSEKDIDLFHDILIYFRCTCTCSVAHLVQHCICKEECLMNCCEKWVNNQKLINLLKWTCF